MPDKPTAGEFAEARGQILELIRQLRDAPRPAPGSRGIDFGPYTSGNVVHHAELSGFERALVFEEGSGQNRVGTLIADTGCSLNLNLPLLLGFLDRFERGNVEGNEPTDWAERVKSAGTGAIRLLPAVWSLLSPYLHQKP
jgi:hypothetical protein